MYEVYESTAIYKNYLYSLKRKIFIFKNLKKGPRLRTGAYDNAVI